MSNIVIDLFDTLVAVDATSKDTVSHVTPTDKATVIDYIDLFVVPGVKPELTEWHKRRNSRIYWFLSSRKMFDVKEFQLHVWRERLTYDDKYIRNEPLRTFNDKPTPTFIRNFTRYLLSELKHYGYIDETTLNGKKIYIVKAKPTLDLINEIASYRN